MTDPVSAEDREAEAQPERDRVGSKRVEPELEKPEFVHLPGLISDEFGIPRSEVRRMIAMGEVLLDGKLWEGDKFDVPYGDLADKEIHIKGDVRHVKMHYKG